VAAAPAPARPAKPAPKAKPAPAGDWVVHLTSADEKKRAQAQLDHARAKGLAARLTTGVVEGKTWYRVTVEGFATPDEARAFAGKEAPAAGFSAAWIGQR
jgi:cell division protein FtsN